MQYFWYALLGAIVLFLLVTVVRALLVRKPKSAPTEYVAPPIDGERAVKKLQQAVMIPTVTCLEDGDDHTQFDRYRAFLETAFPRVMACAEKQVVNGHALIYIVRGSDEALLPVAILAHQDVVPAPEDTWEVPPFSGEIKDGCVYGRGSQDMKSQMIAALEGLEILLEQGKTLRRTVYFCFGHDEELRGTRGARQIVDYLAAQNIRFEYVLDEGGTVLDGKILGIDNKIALIGICEKGYADFRLTVEKAGGHASSPTRRTAVGLLGEALYDLEHNPFPAHWTAPTKELFRALAPHMNPLFKYLFVNRDVFSPLLKLVLMVASPFTATLLHTTMAPTQLQGAPAPNVLPPKADAIVNVRVNTGETVESAQKRIQKIVGKKVRVSVEEGAIDPSPVSDIRTPSFQILTDTIYEVFGGYISAPFPFIAASDAKFYYRLSNNVYRFTPFEKSIEDANRIHAANERQDIEQYVRGVRFFVRLYESSLL